MEKQRDCPVCGRTFIVHVDGALVKYCSKECSKEARRIKNRDRWREANPGWNDGTNKVCEWCGQAYTVPARNAHIARFCSDECRDRSKGHKPMEEYLKELEQQKEETARIKEAERKAKMKIKECAECGNEFETTNRLSLTCSSECSKRRRNRRAWQRKEKRLNANNVVDKDISLKVLYKRDKGTCYLCGKRCNPKDYDTTGGHFTPGPTYPSADHIVPLARGGKHAWDNIRLAHHLCNSIKSDSVPNKVKELMPDNAYVLARKISSKRKQVKQFTKEGKLIATYESTAEAERKTGFKQRGIQDCARGESKSHKGYVWMY